MAAPMTTPTNMATQPATMLICTVSIEQIIEFLGVAGQGNTELFRQTIEFFHLRGLTRLRKLDWQ